MSIFQTFSILDHLDKLEPASGGRYICPGCGGHNLTINKQSGAYHCWNSCECADIRDAIAPLPNRNDIPCCHISKAKPVRKLKSPAPPNANFTLAKLPAPATDSPQSTKDFDPKLGEILKTTYVYSLTPDGQFERWVVRTDWPDPSKPKGRDKTFRQWHRNSSGEAICKKGDALWEAYRIDEFISALKATPGIAAGLVQEGEGGVEKARAAAIASTTFQGSAWKVEDLERTLIRVKQECPDAVLVFLRDNDATGEKKAGDFQEACDRIGIFSVVIDPVAIYSNLPHKGDIVEILAAMDTPEFIRRLEEEIYRATEARRDSEPEAIDIPDSFDPNIEFTQQALKSLYGDKPWICVNDVLYSWTGTYYKPSLDALELKRLSNFCNGYAVASERGIRYPYAKPAKVREALDWVKIRLAVDPAEVNPAGLNCINGVLQLSWDGLVPSWHLVDHDPALYYTYEPVTPYNPDASLEHCDRLLEVLDAPQQEIFLRTIAASLDLAKVRQHKGRLVRGLLLKGHGSNGKDTLRECVAAIYGYRGMTGATLTDFVSYDQGRKFPLARLNQSRVNWASENANTAKLDNIQSLKAFITGDPLSIEGKGKDEYEFDPVGVALFNVNDTPNLQASLQAIKDRYGVLTFTKTFKIGADPSKGELEADPRFKYDRDFLRSEVLPAFLNRVLAALVDLMAQGIDYNCTQKALEDIQAENSHLFQFCKDIGLGYDPNETTTAGEIWEQLEQWYLDNGTLTYDEAANGKKKSIWIDQVRKGDANLKGANQVIARFQSLFPKAKRVTVGKGKMALQGISFISVPPNGEPVEANSEAVVSQLVSQKPLLHKDGEPVTPVFLLDEKNENSPHNFEHCDRGEVPKEEQGEKLPRLAHYPEPVRVSGSPTAPLTASLFASTGSPLAAATEPKEAIAPPEPQQPTAAAPALASPAVTEVDKVEPTALSTDIPAADQTPAHGESLKVGDRVIWDNCPGHCASFNPFTITRFEDGMAWLDIYSKAVAVLELRRSS
jgi:putative DNA primase/helicase